MSIMHDIPLNLRKLRALFLEEDVTIETILIAIGMAISMLIPALTGGAISSPPIPLPQPPSDKE